jgi:hypothetical protein
MTMSNGQQPVTLPEPPPPIGEPLQIATLQVQTPNGIFVMLRLSGPGKVWSGMLNGEDCENWGKQMTLVGGMSKAGLMQS